MSQGVSEAFLAVDSDLDMQCVLTPSDAKARARESMDQYPTVTWVKVYHLDFATNKMTLIKEYRRRESDEEGIVEYV